MAYFSLGTTIFPLHWMELKLLCIIEIITFILEELIGDGLVTMICDPMSSYLDILSTAGGMPRML
jgi:hypothetical protein